jgi:hypothetical protein
MVEDDLLVEFGEVGGHGGRPYWLSLIGDWQLRRGDRGGWAGLLTTKGTKHTKIEPLHKDWVMKFGLRALRALRG